MGKPTEAIEPITMAKGESIGYIVDFTNSLRSSETISSGEVADVPGKIDASSVAPNDAAFVDSGVTVAIGKGLKMRLACADGDDGAVIGTIYSVIVTVTTSDGDTHVRRVSVRVDGYTPPV